MKTGESKRCPTALESTHLRALKNTRAPTRVIPKGSDSISNQCMWIYVKINYLAKI